MSSSDHEEEREGEGKGGGEGREDYPFSSWKGFADALYFSFTNHFYGNIYPRYYDAVSKGDLNGEYIDTYIIENFLSRGFDPQEGLDLVFNAVVKSTLLPGGNIKMIEKWIEMFVKEGAIINPDILFESSFDGEIETEEDLEEATKDDEFRGKLIDLVSHFGLDFSKYGDWHKLEAVDLSETDLFGKEPTSDLRMKNLKFYSEYLKSL